ncbi:MAG: exodeoxyribonuclease V subunit gamma, partial [bacterium]|nr:exodeoxyribonuclease V subunit gamma [bacterium]
PCIVDLDISGCRLIGKIDNIWHRGCLSYRFAEAKAKDRLKAWLLHLVLNAAQNESYPTKSYLICKNASWEMSPLDKGRDLLERLISIYYRGQNELISFFPETSLEYARILQEEGSHEIALKMARIKWDGNKYVRNEFEDLYYDLSFGQIDPFDSQFIKVSTQIYDPLLAHQEKAVK